MNAAPRPKGFTLVEILVAVAVSAAGFAAVFALQVSNLRGNLSTRDQIAAWSTRSKISRFESSGAS